eukprot:c26840_g1_i1 orf=646-1581(-)
MNDLLSRTFTPGKGSSYYVDLKMEGMHNLEMEGMGAMDPHSNLAIFFEEVGEIKGEMEKVKQLLSKLQDAHEESKTIHKAQAMKTLRERMDQDVEEVLKKAKSMKAKLEELDKANISNRAFPGFHEGTPTDRTRTSITNSLRKKLKDLMGEFQVLRQKIMGEYRETIERRYFTVTGQKAKEETVEYIIETGESENFLQKAIQEQGRGQVMETIKEIQERHDAVMEIEKNLLELHQIFLDMAVLVEAQGEQLNDIEHYVNQAASFVDKGAQQLHTARQYQKSSRKCMCIGIILVLVLILIIVVPIIISLKKG